ncbi:hypothetical protein ALC53_08052 [Atta colombica]|uniref:Uncharacterized protein n=1 Tax=Atta colombica TaxID=520822 RepID=A0A151I2I0_9HYME|nr:hypothetical protein ALC53_08052 [Atta colombica]
MQKKSSFSIKRQGGKHSRMATFQRYLRDTITSLTCLAEVKSFRKDERKKKSAIVQDCRIAILVIARCRSATSGKPSSRESRFARAFSYKNTINSVTTTSPFERSTLPPRDKFKGN